MTERKMITKEVGVFKPDACTLQELLIQLQTIIDQFGADAEIDRSGQPYSDGTYFAIMKKIPETDIEMNVRIAMEAKYVIQVLEREQAEFKRLSEKFNKGN